MIGRTLGHYRVVEQLGAGGMGVVYRARDTRLERDVALKVLPPGSLSDEGVRKRFRKEALALSRLNHPNVATIHDFNTEGEVDFIVMELIPGHTLDVKRGAELPEKEVVGIGTQLAQGLAAAHAAGVLHRDLKPSNLRLTPDGRLKILDFGLARFNEPPKTGDHTDTMTHVGAVAGTVPYMAPEQLRGEPIDERSDIYGAGAVLYELATGTQPFAGATTASLIDAILNHAPVRPTSVSRQVAPGLEQIILKALDKDPGRRYQSAKELLVDLERLSGASVAQAVPTRRKRHYWPIAAALVILALAGAALGLNMGGARDRALELVAPQQPESIAVLPLANVSRDPAQDYFVDGMTRELITHLGRIGSMRVTASISSMQYKKSPKPLPEVARELNVKKILTGSVSRSGNRGRIAVELVDVPSGRQIWAQSYDCDLGDALTAQAQIAQAVAREIDVRLTRKDKERLAALNPVNPAAHEAYLRGLYEMGERRPGEAKKFYDKAIELDPNFAPALTALAGWYIERGMFAQTQPPIETFPKAKELAMRAMELDRGDATPHMQVALVKLHHEWDWDGAQQEFRRALELNPSHANAHHVYAHYLLAMDRVEESVDETRKAAELDPLNPTLTTCVGWHCMYARQYKEAIEHCLKLVKQKKAMGMTYYYLGRVYALQRDFDQGIPALETAVTMSSGSKPVLATLGHVYGRAGKVAEAEEVLEQLRERAQKEYVSAFDFAVVYAGLGDRERTFEWLDKAFLERSAWLVHVKWDDRFADVRSDPRFSALLRRIGLPNPDLPAAEQPPVKRAGVTIP